MSLTNIAAATGQIEQPGRDPARLPAQIDALFDRHLQLDNVVDQTVADTGHRFEAAARAVREILSQSWIETSVPMTRRTQSAMEFLIGRSLTNNVTNLVLHPFVERSARGQPRLVWPSGPGTGCRPRQRDGF
jgi:glycogen phosphorylase